MGFYSSALASNPLGSPFRSGVAPWSIELGMELSYVPHLNRQQRTAGYDKPESSNLSPVLPRPRLSLALPGAVVLDASWLPPIQVVDAKANLFGLSLRREVRLGSGTYPFAVTPRISFLEGRITGAITCSEKMAAGTLEDVFYYANICHAHASKDYFDPTHFTVDLSFHHGPRFLGADSYLTAGVRREYTSFDIGVIGDNGVRDLDHPILEMNATRGFGILGLQWSQFARTRYILELNYTPGSLVTVRALAGWRFK